MNKLTKRKRREKKQKTKGEKLAIYGQSSSARNNVAFHKFETEDEKINRARLL